MWFRAKVRGLMAFAVIALLITGGLTWATLAALRAERDRRDTLHAAQKNESRYQADKELADRTRQALWRLDARLAPALAREESRPYPHYIALHSPFPALTATGVATVPGSVYLPSPLMTAELPAWMSLHFQVDAGMGWVSPQVVPADLQQLLRKQPLELALDNVTDSRGKLLDELKKKYPAPTILTRFRDLGVTPSESPQDVQRWADINDIVQNYKMQTRIGNGSRGGEQRKEPRL